MLAFCVARSSVSRDLPPGLMTRPTAQHPTRDSRSVTVTFSLTLDQQLHDSSRHTAFNAARIKSWAASTSWSLLLLHDGGD
jgi:hypothetical protein